GGPMRYLSEGLRTLGLGPLGKVLAVFFAVMCIGGSFGGGNMFQANQAFAQTARVLPFFADKALLFGILVAFLVGMVIIGGIKRIGNVAGAIVPLMCGVYLLAGVAVLIANAERVPEAFGKIVTEAFTPAAAFGGVVGVIVTGFKRAAFSNEAGIGSASIAHSAAATSEPIREGLVALLEPFIDTIVICTMTGLVVVVTGEYLSAVDSGDPNLQGVAMTSNAFATVFSWFPYVLAVAVLLFAYSTMISWSYYGERCWVFLFGKRSSMVYRVLFLVFTVLGAILTLDNVVAFSDLMILGMAFPNIFGLFLLSGQVSRKLDDYWQRYRRGEMPPPPKDKAQPAP
ncbi:MAG TPA: amino acid carrier protein, partial [Sandaracinaceae bacterium]